MRGDTKCQAKGDIGVEGRAAGHMAGPTSQEKTYRKKETGEATCRLMPKGGISRAILFTKQADSPESADGVAPPSAPTTETATLQAEKPI